MNLEEINSPLPPRKVEIPVSPPEEKEANETTNNKIEEKYSAKPVFDTTKIAIIGGVIVLIIAIVLLVFKVLIPNITGKVEEVTLNYWGLWEDNSIIEGVLADFEAKNPGIKVNYRRQQKTDYRTRLDGRLKKKETEAEEVPDIFRIHSSWIPMFADDLAAVPTETAEKIGLDDDFYDVYKEDLMMNNRYMGVPLMYDGLALFYNKELIEAAQVELPKSWWDLQTAAMKLTVKDEMGKIRIAGAAVGLVDNVDHWSDIVGLMIKQNGVDPYKADSINNKNLQDVLTYYTNFKTKYQVWDESLPSSTEMFAAGKLAFYLAPSWRVFNIEEMNPNLKFEITSVPQLPIQNSAGVDQVNSNPVLTDIHWSTYWFEGVNSKSSKQKQAWKLLEYLSSKEALEKMYAAASQIRSFGEIYPRKSMAESINSVSKIKPFIATADKASGWYLSSRTFDTGLNDEMAKYFGNAINATINANGEASGVMLDLRNGINQLMAKYQLSKDKL